MMLLDCATLLRGRGLLPHAERILGAKQTQIADEGGGSLRSWPSVGKGRARDPGTDDTEAGAKDQQMIVDHSTVTSPLHRMCVIPLTLTYYYTYFWT